MTWGEVATATTPPILIIPVGSCEQHGPHLPLHTDTVIAVALSNALAAARTDCVVAPPITVTASGEHQGFPGTLSIGNDAMAHTVVELVRSADWADGVVLVNGHGGNVTAMHEATNVLARERRRLITWWMRVPGGDPHAGIVETSLMLELAPDQVRLELAEPGPVPPSVDLIQHGVKALSPTGVLGDPTGASARAGQRWFAELADDLAATVAEWVERTGPR